MKTETNSNDVFVGWVRVRCAECGDMFSVPESLLTEEERKEDIWCYGCTDEFFNMIKEATGEEVTIDGSEGGDRIH